MNGPFVVSRHHEWRGPASYAPEDRSTLVCMDCGARRVHRQRRAVPPCRPKVEAVSSGYSGLPLDEYLRRAGGDPAAYPQPGNLLILGAKAKGTPS